MLKTYLEISLGMSAVILLALLFTPFLKKRYRAGARYAIWIICAIMLLAPFKPSPKITIEIPQIKHETAARVALTDDVTYDVTETEEAVGAADANTKTETAYVQPSDVKTSEPIDVWAVLTAMWLFGAAAFMLYYIVGYAVFLKKIKPWRRKFELEGYREKPRLVYCRLVKSPMLTGFFKPSILLPRNDYSDTELSMILKHELTHYKRGDLWAKLLFAAVNAIHWFNPVVYIMRKAANRDMEYSCDERVVKGMDRQFCQDYSIAILRCAAGVGMYTAFSTHFSEDKEKLRQRLKNILSGKKKRGIIIGALALIMAVICAGAFGFDDGRVKEENYLFLGTDGRNHIDTVMVAKADKNGIAVTSIPRDTMDLNTYTWEVSQTSVENILRIIPMLVGFETNKYIIADTQSVMSVLSELGTVDFEIPDLYGNGVGMVYDDPYQDLHISLSSGNHELSGKEMLDVMRYRHGNVNEYGRFNGYDNLDRIKMTHSLLTEIIKQKKKILDDENVLEAVKVFISSVSTNINMNDVDNVLKAVKKGDITFELLKGEYGRSDVVLNDISYVPDKIYSPYGLFSGSNISDSVINASDSKQLLFEVISLKIDGAEQIGKVSGEWKIWYNERLGKLHICTDPELSDGTSVVFQPYSDIIFDKNSASGTFYWSRNIRTADGEASKEVLSRERVDGTITGLDTDTPVWKSDNGRYEIVLNVLERK